MIRLTFWHPRKPLLGPENDYLKQPARNIPSLYPGMRSALFSWSETAWFVILLPLFSSLKYYLAHVSSLYLYCRLFLWGKAHCTLFVDLHTISFSKSCLLLGSTGHFQSFLIQHYPKPCFHSINKLLSMVNNFRATACGILSNRLSILLQRTVLPVWSSSTSFRVQYFKLD